MFRYTQNCPVYFGAGTVTHLGEYVTEELGARKALCVYDAAMKESGIAGRAIASLEQSGIRCVSYDAVTPDPSTEVVDEAGEVGLREQVDVIVGIGGGSCLDVAKAATILMTNPGPITKYMIRPPMDVDTKVPLVLVPTTSGTGSEASKVAVITHGENGGKYGVFVNTSLAVIDPELTYSLPKKATAYAGFDAMAHAAECVTGNVTNPHNQLLGCAAIRKIVDNLYTAWSEPDNAQARSEMALAADWAGIAFAETMCHVGHAFADSMSANLHTPHGYNCAIALPVVMEFVAPAVPKEITMVAEAMRIPLKGGESAEEIGRLVADKIWAMLRKMEVEPLKDMGFSREDFLMVTEEAYTGHLSSFSPVEVTMEAARKMAERMYDHYQ